jgi:tetratricopeptide (TPR) repeat protein
MLLLMSLALAAPLRLTLSPEAALQLLPTVQPGRVEVLVYENRANLRAQVKNRRFDGIRRIWAVDMGDVWVVNAILEKPDQSLRIQQKDGSWIGNVVRSAPSESLRIDAPTLDQLAAAPTLQCQSPRLSIAPLLGEDMSYGVEPDDFKPLLPRWTDAEPNVVSWDAVQELRAALFVRHESGEAAAAYYRLGALHRDLGHAREAAYYFGKSVEKGGEKGITELQRAGALLQARSWDAAQTAAWKAWKEGAPEEGVIEILSVVALATQDNKAGTLGLALAHATARPDALALAGALLMQNNCAQQSIPILKTAVQYLRRTDKNKAAEARMLLSDALLLTNDLDAAEDLMGQLSEHQLPESWAGVLRARGRLVSLLRQSPDKWASILPSLSSQRAGLDTEAAESMFLAGQVQEWLGDDRAALESYLDLVDHHRRLTGGDVSRRLVQAWSRRTQRLYAEGRDVEAMQLHAAVWRPFLANKLDDPETLRLLAGSYQRLGLHYRAMAMLGMVAEVEGLQKRDDQATVLQVAGLYLEMGHPELAEDTLAVLRTRSLNPASTGAAFVIDGRIAEQKGLVEQARKFYGLASTVPQSRLEAIGRLAMMDAGEDRCIPALPRLEEVLEDPASRSRLGEGLLRTLHARCLEQVGNIEGSAVEAFLASEQLSDPDSKRMVRYLSAQASEKVQLAPPGGIQRPDPPDIWVLLQDEDDAQREFTERIAALK